MEENTNTTIVPEKEEEGIDIIALVRSLWDGRKIILICIGIFIALGLVSALTMKRTYSVTSVMVPQLGSAKSGLNSLASLAGFDMGLSNTGSELSPLIYPQIVNSVPFRLEMIHTPLHYQKCDTLISMYDYALARYEKPTVMEVVKKYTIGLPGVIFGSKEKPDIVYPGSADTNGTCDSKPLVVSNKEQKMLDAMGKVMSLTVDKKEGYITLTVTGSEPVQTAELAMKAQKLLQDEVTRFRIEKSKSDLEYIQARYDEAKEEAAAEPPADIALLTEIRDLLKKE